MAKKIRTIEQRKRLEHRPKPYWHPIDGLRGAALGFRKHAARGLQGGGKWVLRYWIDGGYRERAFAESDNTKMPANGSTVLTFDQAVERARVLYSQLTGDEFSKAKRSIALAVGRDASGKVTADTIRAAIEAENERREAAGKRPLRFDEADVAEMVKAARDGDRVYRISDVCRDYVNSLEKDGKRWKDADQRFAAFVIPALGDIPAEQLTAKQIRDWMRDLAAERPRVRSPKVGTIKHKKVDETDDDYRRRRAATVNRIWTSFRAALSYAFKHDDLDSAEFQKVEPLKVGNVTVNKADCRPILPEEMDAFLEAVKLEGPEFENLVLVALYTGCRYGELCRIRVDDYDRKHGTLYVRPGKTGYDRVVRVIPEGRELLERLTKGRKRDDMLLKRDGEPWKKSEQARPMQRVLARCELDGVTFKSTRDTFGTWLLNAGVRLVVVADQLGHRNIDITRRHYAKILRQLDTESTALAERIRFVGGADIIPLDAHRSGKAKESG